MKTTIKTQVVHKELPFAIVNTNGTFFGGWTYFIELFATIEEAHAVFNEYYIGGSDIKIVTTNDLGEERYIGEYSGVKYWLA